MHEPTLSPAAFYARIYPQLIELQAAHVYDRVTRESADLTFALTHWTMLPSLLRHEQAGANGDDTLVRLCDLYRAHRQSGDASTYAAALADHVTPRMSQYLADLRHDPSADHPWFGCFGYTVDEERRCVALHFYNAVCPASPFADPAALKDDLRQCVCAAALDVPDAQTAQCGSWINNLPRFLDLFPQAYASSLVETHPDGKSGLGWWGQFVTRNGGIHKERAHRLLSTGEFTYARMLGRCRFDDLLTHVDGVNRGGKL